MATLQDLEKTLLPQDNFLKPAENRSNTYKEATVALCEWGSYDPRQRPDCNAEILGKKVPYTHSSSLTACTRKAALISHGILPPKPKGSFRDLPKSVLWMATTQ